MTELEKTYRRALRRVLTSPTLEEAKVWAREQIEAHFFAHEDEAARQYREEAIDAMASCETKRSSETPNESNRESSGFLPPEIALACSKVKKRVEEPEETPEIPSTEPGEAILEPISEKGEDLPSRLESLLESTGGVLSPELDSLLRKWGWNRVTRVEVSMIRRGSSITIHEGRMTVTVLDRSGNQGWHCVVTRSANDAYPVGSDLFIFYETLREGIEA